MQGSRAGSIRARARGFTYVEALAALTVLALAGGIILATVAQQQRGAELATAWGDAADWVREAEAHRANPDPEPPPPPGEGWTVAASESPAASPAWPLRQWTEWRLRSPARTGIDVTFVLDRPRP